MLTSKLYVEAIAHTADGDRPFITRGQVGKALIALVCEGDRGVTALEVASWAYRLAAYCHELRTRYGLAIRTEREEHPGGWHGRHVLETPVRILFVADSRARGGRGMSGPKNCLEAKGELQAMGFEPVPVLKAIRTKCLDCSGGMASEVRDCLVRNCALYPFRMGTNPWRAPATEGQRQSAARIAIAAQNRRNGRGNDATDDEAA